MEIEMVFNELSLKNPAPDEHTARSLMSELINTIRAATVQGVKRKLRSKKDLDYSPLAPNYSIVQWGNDLNVEREERNFFRILQDKNDPPLLDVPDPEIEISYQGEQGIGIAHAFVFDGLAVSLLSEPKWDCSRLELEVKRLDENEELIDEKVEIIHASRSSHVKENADWIKKCIQTGVRDGLELWNRREELFPNLEFCQTVGKQLQSLGAEEPILQTVKIRLLVILVVTSAQSNTEVNCNNCSLCDRRNITNQNSLSNQCENRYNLEKIWEKQPYSSPFLLRSCTILN